MQTEANQQLQAAESVILEALTRGAVPIKQLNLRFKASLKLSAKQVKAVLDSLEAARKIHGQRKRNKDGSLAKSVESYALGAPPPPPPPPRDIARAKILSVLEAGALPTAELKQHLKRELPKLTAKDLAAVLAEMSETGHVHGKRKRNKDGSLGKTVEAYALGPEPAPPPGEFVDPVLTLCLKMRARALESRVTDEDFVAALLEGLASAGVQVERPGRTEPTPGDRAQVLNSVRELVAREGSGALIPIRKLRGAVALAKPLFDEAVLQLYADDAIILHHHDYVGSLSTAEREALLLDRHGNYYVGVALRGGS